MGLLALDLMLILLGYMPVELKVRYANSTWRDEYWTAWYKETGRAEKDAEAKALVESQALVDAEKAAAATARARQEELEQLQHKSELAEAIKQAELKEIAALGEAADRLHLNNAAKKKWMDAQLENLRQEKEFQAAQEAIANAGAPTTSTTTGTI